MMEISTRNKSLFLTSIIHNSICFKGLVLFQHRLIQDEKILFFHLGILGLNIINNYFIYPYGISIHDSFCLYSILGSDFSSFQTTISFNNLSLCRVPFFMYRNIQFWQYTFLNYFFSRVASFNVPIHWACYYFYSKIKRLLFFNSFIQCLT